MPLYDFHCRVCEVKFETIAQSDEFTAECPHCKRRETDRQVPAHSMCGINTMKNPAMKEAKRKEGKRERLTEFSANEGKWGSSQRHD